MVFWNKKAKKKVEEEETLKKIEAFYDNQLENTENKLDTISHKLNELKGGNKMADEFEDDFPEEEEQPKPQAVKRPMKPTVQARRPVQAVSQAQVPAVEEDRYVSYHQAESAGVKDKQTNVYYDNLYVILAELLSKMEKVSRAVGL